MRSYRSLDHTSEAAIQVEGDTLEELFRAALEGMASILKEGGCRDRATSRNDEVSLEARDSTALLVDFLSEVLTLTQIRRVLYCEAQFAELSETALRASLGGSDAGSFDDDIKAVTYHGAQVRKNLAGCWETAIVFDI